MEIDYGAGLSDEERAERTINALEEFAQNYEKGQEVIVHYQCGSAITGIVHATANTIAQVVVHLMNSHPEALPIILDELMDDEAPEASQVPCLTCPDITCPFVGTIPTIEELELVHGRMPEPLRSKVERELKRARREQKNPQERKDLH